MHAVRVFVRDQERALRFYLDKLGFRLAFDARLHSGQRWVAPSPPDGGAVLSLVEPGPRSPEQKLIGRATQVVFVTEDVVAKFREWHQRGVRFSQTPRLRRVKYERPGPDGTTPAASLARESPAPVWGAVFTRFQDVDGDSFSRGAVRSGVRGGVGHGRRRAGEARVLSRAGGGRSSRRPGSRGRSSPYRCSCSSTPGPRTWSWSWGKSQTGFWSWLAVPSPALISCTEKPSRTVERSSP
jgi:catechol 2,3-dioxygenase-like lactoylglutathione lyase family enzyme